ncbi:MAG: hypothetical protein FJ363_11355 [Gemmatimonadetes bacterium]|nr:hypothetical protein [Gemmatimonadota bacterium]
MMPAIAFAELASMATHGAPTVHLAVVGQGEAIVVAIVFGTLGTVFYPLVKALSQRVSGGAQPGGSSLRGVEDRLDRIERSVEAVALEVERISEGQRFVTKLLAEKTPPQIPPASS